MEFKNPCLALANLLLFQALDLENVSGERSCSLTFFPWVPFYLTTWKWIFKHLKRELEDNGSNFLIWRESTVLAKWAKIEEHHAWIKVGKSFNNGGEEGAQAKRPLNLDHRTAGFTKAKTTNLEEFREPKTMQNSLWDKTMTNFEAFVNVSHEIHFFLLVIHEQSIQGFEHFSQVYCGFLSWITISPVPHLKWSWAQLGILHVKPVISVHISSQSKIQNIWSEVF